MKIIYNNEINFFINFNTQIIFERHKKKKYGGIRLF